MKNLVMMITLMMCLMVFECFGQKDSIGMGRLKIGSDISILKTFNYPIDITSIVDFDLYIRNIYMKDLNKIYQIIPEHFNLLF